MTTPVLHLALPCSRCGAAPDRPCVNRDGSPSKRSHHLRRPVAVCGTKGGYEMHKRKGDPPCPACTDANRRYMQDYRARNPESRESAIAGLKARRRAIRRLVARHRAEFRALLAEESAPSP